MTVRGRFFTRQEYMQHVYSALVDFPGKIRTLPPTILKPEQLWSGKQIISTLILNLVPKDKYPPNLEMGSKIKPHEWLKAPPRPWRYGGTPLPEQKRPGNTTMSESEVIFRHGEFLEGMRNLGRGPFPVLLEGENSTATVFPVCSRAKSGTWTFSRFC